jgi:Domain of unknown function (DUF4279)
MAASIKARFTLTGMNVNPDEISRVIGLTPTKTWRSGEERANSDLRWEHDGWMLSTSEQASLDLAAEIQKLLESIRTRTKEINRARNQFKLDAEIGCSVYIEDHQAPVVHFDREILKAASELGADIDIDIYC